MALPTNAPKVQCTLSQPLLADGTVGVITSAYLKMDKDLVWVESGETIYKESVPKLTTMDDDLDDQTLAFEVIPVDVDGMRDVSGSEIKNWTYTLRIEVEFPNNVSRSVDYTFQPVLAFPTLDLDLVPHVGATTLPPITLPPMLNLDVLDGGTPESAVTV